MSANMPLSEEELHAYADNQLSRERERQSRRRSPASRPAARFAEIRRQNALWRDALYPSLAGGAREMLSAEPDIPPQRLPWLTRHSRRPIRWSSESESVGRPGEMLGLRTPSLSRARARARAYAAMQQPGRSVGERG